MTDCRDALPYLYCDDDELASLIIAWHRASVAIRRQAHKVLAAKRLAATGLTDDAQATCYRHRAQVRQRHLALSVRTGSSQAFSTKINPEHEKPPRALRLCAARSEIGENYGAKKHVSDVPSSNSVALR